MLDNVDEAIVVGEDHHFDYDYDDDEAKVMGGSVDGYQTINEGAPTSAKPTSITLPTTECC